jgi:hypothetical protein
MPAAQRHPVARIETKTGIITQLNAVIGEKALRVCLLASHAIAIDELASPAATSQHGTSPRSVCR